MPGNENSGRRRLAATEAKLPRLGNTEESIHRYLVRLARLVAEDKIDPRRAEALDKIAKTALNALRQRNQNEEIAKLEAWVKEARERRQAGIEREVADRQHVRPIKQSDDSDEGGLPN